MKILHVFRAPVGGLFRHVRDLASEQARAGHEVGIVCDAGAGGAPANEALQALAPAMKLGVRRLPMPRLPGPGDLRALKEIRAIVCAARPDIAHGHGAKGGLYARLAARAGGARAVYTAHGGSLHYSWASPHGAVFLGVERLLLSRTDGLIFVCDYERRAFEAKIGRGRAPRAVVHNGLSEAEFAAVPPNAEARDALFIGELRMLKGVDTLLEALALLAKKGRKISALVVGDGPDREAFEKLRDELGLREAVEMPGAMPAAEAFPRGRVVVVPSRAESFPYVVLEAQAAGRPVVASRVGGIGEMLPDEFLTAPGDAPALAEGIARVLDDPRAMEKAAGRVAELKKRFSVSVMARRITEFYETL